MSIHILDLDERQYTDAENYKYNYGSFAAVIKGINPELKNLGFYSDADASEYCGTIDGLNIGFKYKDKKSFLIHCYELSELPYYLTNAAYLSKQKLFFLSNQTKKLWAKYGIDGKVIGAAVDSEFWYPAAEKVKDKFQICFVNSSNTRSAIDVFLEASLLAFKGNNNVRIIIKDTNTSPRLIENLQKYGKAGLDIGYFNERWQMQKLRDLYSESHLCVNVQRGGAFGMVNTEAMACNTICLAADIEPFNEIVNDKVGVLLPAYRQISLNEYLPEATNFGLTNCFPNLPYPAEPLLYDFDKYVYAEKLKEIYDNWSSKYSLTKPREYCINKYKWRDCAEKLVNGLYD